MRLMESELDYWSAKALLEWQVELGATEAMLDAPVDRYGLEEQKPKPARGVEATPVPVKPKEADPVAEAQKAAQAAQALPSLRAAMEAFEHCELKPGARNLVFADGQAGARVMVIGGAPGRDEDLEGRPFVGAAGRLLDKMLAAIDLSREKNVYITTVLPWRPPQNRDPLPVELAMLKPFLERHVALAQPDILVVMGDIACQAVLGKRGLSRLRGQWDQVWGKPVLPMLHPDDLIRQPHAKRQAWADLLALRARLNAQN